ncbi:MAG: hypothetical protein VSS75_014080 [Candidatus Parabeggiatoa sp.]|nr:hypothetical protein [Candidatus Parabeggiatoa sp.]
MAELTSIGALDEPQYEMMLGIIALRAWMEPHQTIVDGTAITEELAKKFGYIE